VVSVALSKAREQELLLAYQQTIKQAFREVSDALIGYSKIRELREQAKVQEERLVSPEQLQALHTCQTSRGHSTGGIRMSGGGHGSGPCAELSKNSAPMSGPNKKPQPESEPQN
jgi:hypothetical protein